MIKVSLIYIYKHSLYKTLFFKCKVSHDHCGRVLKQESVKMGSIATTQIKVLFNMN